MGQVSIKALCKALLSGTSVGTKVGQGEKILSQATDGVGQSKNSSGDRNRQVFNPLAGNEDDLDGVPLNAPVYFPCSKRTVDLMGYGLPSERLPYDLRYAGYWGYKYTLRQRGRGVTDVDIVATVASPGNRRHASEYLYWNWDKVVAAQQEWDRTHGKPGA